MEIGANFLKARNRIGMEQKDAAARLEITPGFLSKIENGKKRPNVELILKASEIYKVKPGYFFEGKSEVDLEHFYVNKNLEFIEDVNKLSGDQIVNKYKVKFDGKELTESELKGMMAYIRSLRAMEE